MHANGTTAASPSSTLEVKLLFGIPIHAATIQQAVERCERAILTRERLLVGVVNAAKLVNMRRQAQLRQAVLDADLVLADGVSVVWASRLLRRSLPERVAGIDLFEHLLRLGNQKHYSVFFLGAEQAVLDEVVRRARARYPHLRIAGYRNGYFKDDEAPSIAEAIRSARPDILFVGITSPHKEEFLAQFGPMMNVPVCHGVGGSFDVMAGRVKRAPLLWQRCGCEWLYRVLQEPRRLWKRYLITNSIFMWMVLRELLRGRQVRSDATPAPALMLQRDSTDASASAALTGGITIEATTTCRCADNSPSTSPLCTSTPSACELLDSAKEQCSSAV